MVFADAFVLLTDLRHFAQLKSDAKGIQCGAPRRAIRVGARDDNQAFGFLAAIASALVGKIAGCRRAFEQSRALAVVARPYLQDGLGKAKPICAVVRRNRDDLAEELHAGAEIVALKGGIGFAP